MRTGIKVIDVIGNTSDYIDPAKENEIHRINANKDIFEAILEMRNNKVKQLLVFNGPKLIGMITQEDILNVEPQLKDVLR